MCSSFLKKRKRKGKIRITEKDVRVSTIYLDGVKIWAFITLLYGTQVPLSFLDWLIYCLQVMRLDFYPHSRGASDWENVLFFLLFHGWHGWQLLRKYFREVTLVLHWQEAHEDERLHAFNSVLWSSSEQNVQANLLFGNKPEHTLLRYGKKTLQCASPTPSFFSHTSQSKRGKIRTELGLWSLTGSVPGPGVWRTVMRLKMDVIKKRILGWN